ncbi:MOSC domain-containing protein [Rubrobacter aplysinae]|uniref:MOSC domain-containing protein n=1 Tax=Rubrobacter aplysinae TaxID=909625 RepID=UPI000A88C954|nr:MOSC domain-containing protein [Rubrobacter aplysinae]
MTRDETEAVASLLSLNAGLPAPLDNRGKAVQSGFVKSPVQGKVWLSRTGLAGDGQADLKAHGGPEKAACVYPLEHYPYWAERLGRELPPAAFGENFSTQGLTEPGVCIGDVFRVGEAAVQVSQPRRPCYKLAARYGERELALRVQQSSLTGFYFRVLEEGRVAAGDELYLVERPAPEAPVSEANRIMHHDEDDLEATERLLGVEELSLSWRRTFEKRLTGEEEDTAPRLSGPQPG